MSITLTWADLIRKRLKELNAVGVKYKNDAVVEDFIKPIMEYAKNEERRITEHFRKVCQ